MNKNYVIIKNLNKIIKGTSVLTNINLELEKGKIYGFRGKNGSGKTMLFRAICGLIKPTQGEIIIDGEKLGDKISFPKSVGVLIEYPGFMESLTAFDNLQYLARIKNIIDDIKITEVIKKVGLDPNSKLKVKKYSLGMKQRLGIAQAIMEDPELLILDEPTNALDEDGVKEINNILKYMKSKGTTILISSHDKDELEYICDEIYSLNSGKIINYGLGEKNNEK